MNHTRTIRLPGVTVWSECANSAGKRYYDKVQQPTTLPTLQFNPSDPTPKTGISAMAFSNPDGTLVATKSDNMPSSLWIWSIKLLRPYAVLVHLNPIKSFTWHPSIPDLLMIQCENAGEGSLDSTGVVYLWSSTWKEPRTIQVPMEKITGSNWAKWVVTPRPSRSNNSSVASTSPQPYNGRIDRSHSPGDEVDKRPMLLFGDREGFVVGYVEDEQLQEDEMEQDDMTESRPWANSNIDWDYYSPSRDIPKRTPSSASHCSNLSIPGSRLFDISKSRGGLGAVSEPARNSQQDADETFEYRVSRKHTVSVRT